MQRTSSTNPVAETIAVENTGDAGIFCAKKEALTLPAAGVQFPIRLQQSIAPSDGILADFPEKVNMNISSAAESLAYLYITDLVYDFEIMTY